MSIKQNVILELQKKDFPDLKFLSSEEVLDNSLEILDELLQVEIDDFYSLLELKNEDLTFESFEDDNVLGFFWSILNHLEGVKSSEKIRNIIETFRPKLQDFSNEVAYSKELFEKYLYVEKNLELDEEQKRIMFLRIKSFKDRGIDLPKEKQERVKEINKKLSSLSDKFTNNIVDEEKDFEYLITDFEIIKNLPEEVLNIARKNGEEKGGWLFDADPTSTQALMKYCTSPEIRQDIQKFGYSVASKGKFDNRENILQILQLKDEKAKILGYDNYAQMSLNSKMADSPEQIFDLVEGISAKAREKAKNDLGELETYFSLEKLESYDIAYYSRILKEEKYDLDEKEVKKYFEFENVLSYMFDFVQKFYSIQIKEIKAEIYDENIRVFEIYKDGKMISYYFLDAFYRKTKRPGAWADCLREKEYYPTEKSSIVVNVCNFQKSSEGKTTLYLRDVETLFHEFGHALHEILTESKYSELSGLGVEWDFVELPSQLMENWVSEKNSMKKLSKHVDSGEQISDEIIHKMEKLKYFMSGVFVARQNEFSLLDMSLYSGEIPSNTQELDKKTLDIVNKYSIFQRLEDYKMYCSFNHIFGGGYSAGYYSYMWAELLEADVFEKIKEMGMFDPQTGEKLLSTIIGQGTRKKASELFYDFMGRDLDNKAFMQRYGI